MCCNHLTAGDGRLFSTHKEPMATVKCLPKTGRS